LRLRPLENHLKKKKKKEKKKKNFCLIIMLIYDYSTITMFIYLVCEHEKMYYINYYTKNERGPRPHYDLLLSSTCDGDLGIERSAPAGKFLPKFPSTLFVRTGASNENCSFSRNVKGKEISGDTVCSNAFDYNSMKSPDLLLKGSTSIAAGLTTEVS
jgi:hypothetical protein